MGLAAVARQFAEEVVDIAPLGNGHINDTYLVSTQCLPFVLQKINRQVFPQPAQIMANLQKLNQHVRHDNPAQSSLQLPKLVKTVNGHDFFRDENNDYWRALSYIENSESVETLSNLQQAEQVGKALGQFHRLTHGLASDSLYDTLPGFHIAPDYFREYQNFAACTQVAANKECEDFIACYQHIINDLEGAKAKGLLAVRAIHGDPKLNNFLFDKTSGKIISIIDLDTVKPGLIHYDIGDCIRSCCHVPDTNAFSLEFCEVILASYLKATRALLTEQDCHYLYPAIRLIPFELGLRFYSDYLNGNRYFKVTDPAENLQRALAQFQLSANIQQQSSSINAMIEGLVAQ